MFAWFVKKFGYRKPRTTEFTTIDEGVQYQDTGTFGCGERFYFMDIAPPKYCPMCGARNANL